MLFDEDLGGVKTGPGSYTQLTVIIAVLNRNQFAPISFRDSGFCFFERFAIPPQLALIVFPLIIISFLCVSFLRLLLAKPKATTAKATAAKAKATRTTAAKAKATRTTAAKQTRTTAAKAKATRTTAAKQTRTTAAKAKAKPTRTTAAKAKATRTTAAKATRTTAMKAKAKPKAKALKTDYGNVYSRVYHAEKRKGLHKEEARELWKSINLWIWSTWFDLTNMINCYG